MATRKGHRSATRRRRQALQQRAFAGGALLLVLLVVFWSAIWPYVLGAVVLGAVGTSAWWLWRTDRLLRSRDRAWRHGEEVKAGRRTLAEVDAMSGTEFEELVAALCRRDGCAEIRRVGGSGDNGADVRGRLPDGRTMVIQCKRYAPSRAIASHEVRDLRGAQAHFDADVAIFVTTTRFSRQAEDFAVNNGILAIHRNHLGLWNNGARLESLISVNGAGQGDAKHLRRWKRAYGKRGET
ncbi:restriction endonuclease [Streptomyces sp. NBRC 110611]|uniref:restriction endonuclease n=1 Tax=Streptomyces sp. NBRC 110611 TaxID=1621259 RepID=UPI00099FF5D8|nr:restriction endonuclease [Streptomyces sp. NBRC 110611]